MDKSYMYQLASKIFGQSYGYEIYMTAWCVPGSEKSIRHLCISANVSCAVGGGIQNEKL